ncbi:MAG: redoxin domain-containing protein [Pseudomonadota bacterium]
MRVVSILVSLVTALGLACLPGTARADIDQGIFSIRLQAPENPEHRRYLGLGNGDTFALGDLSARVLVIEIFSMYCPHCQREAPVINRLYEAMQADDQFRDAIRLMGIGVGNTPYEVDFFRQTYDIPFPLFADADFTIHRLIGEVRTPHFIGILTTPTGEHRIFMSESGAGKVPEEFLKEILEKSGLSKGGQPQ